MFLFGEVIHNYFNGSNIWRLPSINYCHYKFITSADLKYNKDNEHSPHLADKMHEMWREV